MSLLAGPVFAVAGVMGIAGALKLAQPRTAAKALAAAGLPESSVAVRVLGLTELMIGATAIAFGNVLTASLMAVYYAGFAVFALILIRRAGTTAPCGCFGETAKPEPTTWMHVAMNIVAAALCTAAIIWPTGGLFDVLADQPLAGIPFIVLTLLCGWLWYLGLTVVPGLIAASQSRPQQAAHRA